MTLGLGNMKGGLRVILLATLSLIIAFQSHESKAVSSDNNLPILLGVYPEGWIDQNLVDNLLVPMDAWTGKHTTLVGLSSDLEDTVPYLTSQLNVLWNNGYTPFINLTAGYFSQPTAYQIAAGEKDTAIAHWAQVYASWALGGKFAYIAILPNMNTSWVSYGRDPGNYKLAFARIQQIFTENDVLSSEVRWVFAPTIQVQLPFEPYYPGDELVDIVGFNAYNDGYCANSLDPWWDEPAEAIGFGLREVHEMSPAKPIFITRLGTTAYNLPGQASNAAKNQWLQEAYTYTANDPGIRAVLYDNSTGNCDWPIFSPGAYQFDGYKSAIADTSYGYMTPNQLSRADLTPYFGEEVTYLPFIRAANEQPVLLGTYSQEWIGSQRVMENEYHALDSWAGKRLSIAGLFVDMFADPLSSIEMTLETAWDNGYTPFVNLTVQYNAGITAKQIATGYADNALHQVAQTYATMVQHNHRMAFFAPLQEMNGDWVPYGMDPANFILAYRRIQGIFAAEGVPSESIRWVFAPNGWNAPINPPFEEYYPGDAYVDILGFSGYNFGYCPYGAHPGWETPDIVYESFIHRMSLMSPEKPIFIAQTGTSALTQQGKSVAAKNQWLVDAYNLLAAYPAVRAIIYYNRWDAECDWSIYQLGGEEYSGYQLGVANAVYGYVGPVALKDMIFSWP